MTQVRNRLMIEKSEELYLREIIPLQFQDANNNGPGNNTFQETVESYHSWLSELPEYADTTETCWHYKHFVKAVHLILVHCSECRVESSRVVPCAGLHEYICGPCRCQSLTLACIRHGPHDYFKAVAIFIFTGGKVSHLNADLGRTCKRKMCKCQAKPLQWFGQLELFTPGKSTFYFVLICILSMVYITQLLCCK